MADLFLWYDCNTARIVPLPIWDILQVTFGNDHSLGHWCVVIFHVLEGRLVCAASCTIDETRLETHRWTAALKLLPIPEGATNDTPADPKQVQGSTSEPDDPYS